MKNNIDTNKDSSISRDEYKDWVKKDPAKARDEWLKNNIFNDA